MPVILGGTAIMICYQEISLPNLFFDIKEDCIHFKVWCVLETYITKCSWVYLQIVFALLLVEKNYASDDSKEVLALNKIFDKI